MPLYNDEMLVKVVLKHYQSASRIIFFDMGSTDDGPKIALSVNREVIFVENKFDDLINIKIRPILYKNTTLYQNSYNYYFLGKNC